jgi:hypothetical protein
LHGKSACFAAQKSLFCFVKEALLLRRCKLLIVKELYSCYFVEYFYRFSSCFLSLFSCILSAAEVRV